MAVTATVVRRGVQGNQRSVTVDIVGPASYTTGGEALTLAQFQYLFPEIAANAGTADWTKVLFFDAETSATTTPAFLTAVLDKTNGKMVYTTAGAQTTAATNLSAQTIRVRMIYGQVTG